MTKLLALISLLTFSATSIANTIGIVDFQRVLISVAEGKNVRKKLEKSFNDKKKILKKDEDAIKKAQENFKKQSLVMNDSAKMKKEREIQELIIKFQQKTMNFQKEIQGMEDKMKKPIIDKVQKVVLKVSESKKVDMTFERNSVALLYAKKKQDLTDDVIKAYNKAYPAK